MEGILISFFIMVSLFIVFCVLKNFLPSYQDKMIPQLSPEQEMSDMMLIKNTLNRYIMRILFEFASKDITFSKDSSSSAQIYSKGHYRELIKYLLRPDVLFDDNDNTTSFFTYFVSRVYIDYISETSSYIKSLLFKYHSGFTSHDYFTKTKKDIPSALPFITDYVKQELWKRFYENEAKSTDLFNQLQNSNEDAGKLTEWLNNYDAECICKLALNIYDSNSGIQDNVVSTKKSKLNNEVIKNELPSKLNEQSK